MFKFLSDKRLMFVSPWLMAASIGLMTLIIVVLAVNNLKREMSLLNDGLQLRGQALANFVAAGTRASMMQGMEGARHTQSLIEQASHDPNILFIAVIDRQSNILAHSDPNRVGTPVSQELARISSRSGPKHRHVVHDPLLDRSVFMVVSEFAPFGRHPERLRGRGGGQIRQRHPLMPGGGQVGKDGAKAGRKPKASDGEIRLPDGWEQGGPYPYDWCRNFYPEEEGSVWQGSGYKILVGLDMTEQEKLSRQAKFHILSLSMILLLVGLGGWASLLVAQSFRASQDALKNIQAFADLLVLKLPMGIIATEQHGRIKTLNKAMAAMVGVEPKEAIAETPSRVLPKVLADFFDTLGAEEEVFEREVRLEGPKSGRLVVHVTSVPIVGDAGDFVGRVLLVHDLTELKKLEREVVKHDRLVALGKMAAGVAHEVRNPLSSIKGFATLLGSNFKEGSEGQKSAQLLVNEVERLNRSITELLNYSRPLPLKKTPVDLGTLLENSLRLMSTDADELGIELALAVQDDLPRLEVDGDRVGQVLLNLFLNAFQAMEEGGKLTVSACETDDEGMVEITVQDSGAGISAEDLGRITDPYFTTKPEGTGLGLALAHKIIDEHGGALRFESQPGEGVTVRVRLPLSN